MQNFIVTKEKLEQFIDYTNNFLSVEKWANYYNVEPSEITVYSKIKEISKNTGESLEKSRLIYNFKYNNDFSSYIEYKFNKTHLTAYDLFWIVSKDTSLLQDETVLNMIRRVVEYVSELSKGERKKRILNISYYKAFFSFKKSIFKTLYFDKNGIKRCVGQCRIRENRLLRNALD